MNTIKTRLAKLFEVAAGIALVSTSVLAASTPTKFPTDEIWAGKSGSTANHKHVFDFGLGASNPSLSVDNATKSLAYSNNSFILGDTSASTDKFIYSNRTSTPAYIEYDHTAAAWKFSNDGVTATSFGGGGSGFVNSVASILTSADNTGFESGATVWTVTGGTFTANTSTPIYGTTSAVFTASGTGQFFQSALQPLDRGLYGVNCELDFSYKYAGTGGDYEARVFDGTSNVATLALPTSASPKEVSIPFICPSSGSLRVRFASTVASPGALTVDGYGKNFGLISLGAQLPGSPKLALGIGIGSCSGTQSVSGATFVDFPSQTGCAVTTTAFNNGFGSITAAAVGFGPTLTFPRLGIYEVAVSFAGLDGGQGYQDQIVDGSGTLVQMGPTVSGSPAFYMQTVRGFYMVTSTSAITFKIQGRSVNNTHNVAGSLPDAFQWTIREL